MNSTQKVGDRRDKERLTGRRGGGRAEGRDGKRREKGRKKTVILGKYDACIFAKFLKFKVHVVLR